ncbi:MAG: glycosyltransferase [Nocardioides sp.]
MTRTVLLLVGTDHHPFQRAVGWADARQTRYPEERVFIQYGKSQAPLVAAGKAFLSPAQMREFVTEADVVITHGGPGTISDARQAGHRPVVFPRDPNHGEHVDDHQQRFAQWCHRRGLVHIASTVDGLDQTLATLDLSGTRGQATADSEAAAAIGRVAALLNGPPTARAVRPGACVVLQLAAGSATRVLSLEGVLAGTAGLMVLGDVTSLWQRGVEQNRRCDCGRRFAECEFWTRVGKQAFGGWDRAVIDGVPQRAQRDLGTPWRLAGRYLGRRQRNVVLEVSSVYRALFEAARDLARVRVLCTSSADSAGLAWSRDRQLDVRSLLLSGRRASPAIRYRGLASAVMPSDGPGQVGLSDDQRGVLAGLIGDTWSNVSAGTEAAALDHPMTARLR